MGVYSLGINIVFGMTLIATLGLPRTLSRYIARLRAVDSAGQVSALLRWALPRVVFASTLGAGLIYATGPWLSDRWIAGPEVAKVVPWLAMLVVLQAPGLLLGETLRGFKAVTAWMLVTQGLLSLVRCATIVALLALGGGLLHLFSAELGSHALVLVVLVVMVARRLQKAPRGAVLEPALRQEAASFARMVFFHNIVIFLSSRADVLVLGIFLPGKSVGIYAIAVVVVGGLMMVLEALVAILGPVVSDLHARREQVALRQVYLRATHGCFAVACPLGVVLLVFAPHVLGIFGPEFRAGAATLGVLLTGTLIFVLMGPAGMVLQMTGHQRLLLNLDVLKAVSTLVLMFLLIPHWGLVGAAFAVALPMAASGLWEIAFARRRVGIPIPVASNRYLWLPLAAACTTSLGIRALSDFMSWPPLITLVVAFSTTGLAAAVVVWRLFLAGERV